MDREKRAREEEMDVDEELKSPGFQTERRKSMKRNQKENRLATPFVSMSEMLNKYESGIRCFPMSNSKSLMNNKGTSKRLSVTSLRGRASASKVKQQTFGEMLIESEEEILKKPAELEKEEEREIAVVPLNLQLAGTGTTYQEFKTRAIGVKNELFEACLSFLNTANMEELQQLKGIGAVKAAWILELREEEPFPFKQMKVEDLKAVSIWPKQFHKMAINLLEFPNS